MKIPVDGGSATTLASNQSFIGDIAVDSTNVYWTVRNEPLTTADTAVGAVMKVSLDGGTPTTLASAQFAPIDLAVDDTNVYWLAGGNLMKTPTGGGSITVLATGQVQWLDRA